MNSKTIKILATITYLAVLLTNYLANALPINNVTTGQVSNNYANLFAPASITFSIWAIIYLFLGAYILYQFQIFGKKTKEKTIQKIGSYFIITSIANILWILTWHYDYILISVILMLTILISLIKIANTLRKEKLNKKEYVLIKLPFSIYFGWITIATIANITTYLVSINWNGFGITETIWTIIILIIGTIIGILTTTKNKDSAYLAVFIWAYTGIILKHTSSTGFNNQHPEIITTALISILLFILTITIICYKKNKKKN